MPTGYVSASRVLVLIAVIIFVLAAVGFSVGGISFVPLGLAVWAAAGLFPGHTHAP